MIPVTVPDVSNGATAITAPIDVPSLEVLISGIVSRVGTLEQRVDRHERAIKCDRDHGQLCPGKPVVRMRI
jgi:hypothetical protein